MPIDYGSNDVTTSGNFVASSGNFTTALTVNNIPVATGTSITITNATDNRVLTSANTGGGINAESNLTFDGTTLGVTGVIDIDNLRLDGNTISSTNSNGNIVLAPNGTGDVQADADTLRVGDANAAATITTNGTGNLTINTNSGTNSGSITIQQGANNDIILEPNGTGQLQASSTGNARGQYAVDWQRQRTLNTQVASGNNSVIGGGRSNTSSGESSTVGGGAGNTSSGSSSTVAGGVSNISSGVRSTVGGGQSNTSSGRYSTVGGGRLNTNSSYYSTISGGTFNSISLGSFNTVGGGHFNSSSGQNSTVGGGSFNISSGLYTTVPGGFYGVASLYGEEARASGRFNTSGDAQVRQFILRNITTSSTNITLYLDGSSSEITIPADTSWFYTINIIARNRDSVETAAYKFEGALERSALTTLTLGNVKTTIHEDDINWDVNLSVVSDTTLRINCSVGAGQNNVYWVAHATIVQVTVPSNVPSYS